MINEVFIEGNVPSLKNGKTFAKGRVIKSKTVQAYLKSHGIKSYSTLRKTVEGYAKIPDTFKPKVQQLKKLLENKEKPYLLEFYFIRDSHRRFDLGNCIEILADLFTAYDLWEDDNCKIFLPFPRLIDGQVFKVDKDNPGVIIRIKPD